MSKTENHIVITHATELKPSGKYLIVVDENATTKENMALLSSGLHGMGIENAVVMSVDGDPNQLVKIIEQPETAPSEA